MYKKIEAYLQKIESPDIPKSRMETLDTLSAYLKSKLERGIRPQLNFICTHNSRRSQLSQVIAKVMAECYLIPLNTYSGGMEVTEVHENVFRLLEEIGCQVKRIKADRSEILISYGDDQMPIQLFSKKYQDVHNPSVNFAAVMTCSSAEETCPFIPNADQRISLPYDDPKKFDGTEREAEAYRACADLIASEMKYVFKSLKVKSSVD